jgi:hypothetical protein
VDDEGVAEGGAGCGGVGCDRGRGVGVGVGGVVVEWCVGGVDRVSVVGDERC